MKKNIIFIIALFMCSIKTSQDNTYHDGYRTTRTAGLRRYIEKKYPWRYNNKPNDFLQNSELGRRNNMPPEDRINAIKSHIPSTTPEWFFSTAYGLYLNNKSLYSKDTQRSQTNYLDELNKKVKLFNNKSKDEKISILSEILETIERQLKKTSANLPVNVSKLDSKSQSNINKRPLVISKIFTLIQTPGTNKQEITEKISNIQETWIYENEKIKQQILNEYQINLEQASQSANAIKNYLSSQGLSILYFDEKELEQISDHRTKIATNMTKQYDKGAINLNQYLNSINKMRCKWYEENKALFNQATENGRRVKELQIQPDLLKIY